MPYIKRPKIVNPVVVASCKPIRDSENDTRISETGAAVPRGLRMEIPFRGNLIDLLLLQYVREYCKTNINKEAQMKRRLQIAPSHWLLK